MKALKLILAYLFILLAIGCALLLSIPAHAQTTSVALNESSGNYTSNPSGINIGTQDYFEEFLLKNLAGQNPGFQSMMINLNATVAATGTTTTFEEANPYSQLPANYFVGADFQVMCHGGQLSGSVQICTGGNYGCTGTVTANGATTGSGTAFTVTACANDFAENDQIYIYWPTLASIPITTSDQLNYNDFGWGFTDGGDGTQAIDTTSAHLAPNTNQCLQLDTSGSSGSTVQITTNFDSSGVLNYAFSGTYTQALDVYVISGSGLNLVMNVNRSGGGFSSTSSSIPLSGAAYTTYSRTFSESETGGTAPGIVSISYELTGQGVVCVDNAQLTGPDTNPSLLRDQIQTDLVNVMHVGEARFSWPINGDSLDNMLTTQQARRVARSEGPLGYNQVDISLHEFLAAMAAWGVKDVWLSLPITFRYNADAANFADYMGGGSGTTYGAKRIALGQTAPWTSVFSRIVVEYGNEVWNTAAGNQAMAAYSVGPNAFWNYPPIGIQFCGALKADGNWNSSVEKCALGVNTATDGVDITYQIIPTDTSHYVDLAAINNYMQYSVTTSCALQNIFQSATAQPYGDAFDTASIDGFYQSATAGLAVGVYEGQNATGAGAGGSICSQTQINGFPEGEGYALADTRAALIEGKTFNMLDWNHFVLFQSNTDTTSSGGATTIADWGAFTGPGGAYNNPRLMAYGYGVANACNLGTGYAATPTSPPTFNYTGGNSVNNLSNVPLVEWYPFKNGSNRCIVVENYDYSSSHTFAFTGSSIPAGTVTVTTLTAGATNDDNETPNSYPGTYVPSASTVTNPTSFTLAPHSLEAISWSVGSFTPAPITITGSSITIQGNITIP